MTISRGFYYALLTMVLWGIGPVFAKLGVRNIPATHGFIIRSVGVFFFFFIFILATRQIINIPTMLVSNWKYTLFLFIEGFCGAFLGQLTYYHAQKYWETSKTVLVVSAFPLLAMVLAILILKEPLTFKKIVGALLIVIGIYAIK
ncbi:MAG TPA: EamA family transporter [bacterium]|mgnify:CR=1 FL=1|nr:EamA family transporter [bacterium]